jgi:hypothetical protein
MRRNEFIFVILAIAFGSSSALGQVNETLAMQRTALKDITDAAERICNSIPLSGTSQSAELSGQAKAEVNGVIKKVAELGVQGAGKYQTSEFSNVLQRDLAQAIQTNANCKQTVFGVLVDRMIPARSSGPASVPADPAKAVSQQSVRQRLRQGDAIFVEIQMPKPPGPNDGLFLRIFGGGVAYTIEKYDQKTGGGDIKMSGHGGSGRITATENTLNIASSLSYGCSGSFRRGDGGVLRGRISCIDASGQAYPGYESTINIGW